MEIILLIIGIGAFVASFLVPASGEQLSREERKHADEEIKACVEKHLNEASSKINHSVDEAVQYAVEKTERSLERLSNEKIMGVSEYADTVLTDIHKNHEEVVFLYDMLNDKQTALKNTVAEIEKTAKAPSTLASQAKETADKASQDVNEAALSAEEAAKSAEDAAGNADEASQIAEEALQSANEALLSADEAMQRADEAAKRANEALLSADEAALRSDAAKQTASAASQVANEAILSADRAKQRAGDAMKSAKEIQKMNGIEEEEEEPKPRKINIESQNLSGLARVQGIQEAEAEAERVKAAEAEAERVRAAEAEAERARAAEAEAERARAAEAEAERMKAARAEAARAEAERMKAARAEAERMKAARAEAERMRVARAETERLRAAEAEAEREKAAQAGAEQVKAADEWLRAAQAAQIAQADTERAKPTQEMQDAEISVMDISQRTQPKEPDHFQPFVVPRVNIIGEPADDTWEKETKRTTRTRSAAGSRRSAPKKVSASDNRTWTENASQNESGLNGRGSVTEERNNNEKILKMHREGKSNIAIAKELGIGVGEVKLVIDLFR
ncbi:MAG: hypothetical protein K2N41_02350 [Lachnospiraceae bacterium]|nr:hypothetical protein [Lachnospiraceae bacterium]